MIDEIGGYFELELPSGDGHYHDCIRVCTARHALKLILQEHQPDKLFVPYYMCYVVLGVFADCDIDYEFYSIDENFEILHEPTLSKKDCLLYVNYFSVKGSYVKSLSDKYGSRLILDNSQAFFEKPRDSGYSFYSARKFFGVGDGAYVHGLDNSDHVFNRNLSTGGISHLIGRLELSATEFYEEYKRNESGLASLKVKAMSKLSERILDAIDYQKVRLSRESNFSYYHDELDQLNEIRISPGGVNGPMVYPFLVSKDGLRENLIANKIYVATYWPDIEYNIIDNSQEQHFIRYLVPLPVDQRYGYEEISFVINLVKSFLVNPM